MNEEPETQTVRESILEAKQEVEAAAPVVDTPAPEAQPQPDPAAPVQDEPHPLSKQAADGRDEKGRFKGKQLTQGDLKPADVIPAVEAPKMWSAERKAAFAKAPPDIQKLILDREKETEGVITRQDEERNFGKALKQIVAPYEAIIRSEGGTPERAVQDLLNTAYVLRQGTAEAKENLILQTMHQFGVDPRRLFAKLQGGQQQQPAQQQINPDQIAQQVEQKLRQQMEADKIQQGYQAFVSNPEFVHRENPLVRAAMASLFSGPTPPKDYVEAYQQAITQLTSLNGSAPTAQIQPQARPQDDIAAKKAAAKSVTGSPGPVAPNSSVPNRSLREELTANLRALSS